MGCGVDVDEAQCRGDELRGGVAVQGSGQRYEAVGVGGLRGDGSGEEGLWVAVPAPVGEGVGGAEDVRGVEVYWYGDEVEVEDMEREG